MNHLSTSTAEAEPPFSEPPFPSEEELTLDLAEPALTETPLPDEGEATLDLSDEDEETLALPNKPEDPLVGAELQQGKYRVLALRPAALAGSSLLGASYTALHTDLQKRLTLRYLPLDPQVSAEGREQLTMQFLREVRVLARLDHPSLPRVHDYFCEGDACYVVMDELAERTLADVLAEAAQAGLAPALPPVEIARLGVELARALGYLHQQRPPLALGGLRAADVALPDDGPAQLVSLGALSLVASASSVSLPGFAPAPTLPMSAQMPPAAAAPDGALFAAPVAAEEQAAGASADAPPVSAEAACAPTLPPQPADDVYSLGVLLQELAGGAAVVDRVADRLYRPEEASQAQDAADAPPISLALAMAIQVAAHADAERRFQQSVALENALARAWLVERRIGRQAERAGPDDQMTRLEDSPSALDIAYPDASAEHALATQSLPALRSADLERLAAICWRCGGRNRTAALLCRVCGARLPASASITTTRGQARPTRKLSPNLAEPDAWAEWGEDTEDEAAPRPRWSRPVGNRLAAGTTQLPGSLRRATQPAPQEGGQRLLWALVWVCFAMAFLLGGATILVTYLALH